MKRVSKIALIIVSCAAGAMALLYAFVILASHGITPFTILFGKEFYETNSIADYGKIKGNYNNEIPKEFIFSFFPEEIDESFSDVVYHYKAKKGDTYAYEAYLEFTVTDVAQYQQLVATYTKEKECPLFTYDDGYRVYTVSNQFFLTSGTAKTPMYIEESKVGLVLFSDVKQQLIFVALGMFDGGGANCDELGYFFKKFNVDIPTSYVPYNYKTRTGGHLVLTGANQGANQGTVPIRGRFSD